MKLPNGATGVVLWEGASLLDGAPIVVIMTKVVVTDPDKLNRKTGDMMGTWILRRDMSPLEAVRERKDSSICGDCKLRGLEESDETDETKRPCYVNIAHAQAIWKCYKRGGYAELFRGFYRIVAARFLRIGSYGDPAAVPTWVWDRIVSHVRGHSGYTHQWRTCDQDLKGICMASVDNTAELQEARKLGWRTFRTRLRTEPVLVGEVICPASKEGGFRTQCADCRLCDGAKHMDERRTVAIIAHGASFSKAAYRRVRQPRKQLRIL